MPLRADVRAEAEILAASAAGVSLQVQYGGVLPDAYVQTTSAGGSVSVSLRHGVSGPGECPCACRVLQGSCVRRSADAEGARTTEPESALGVD